MRAGHVLVLLSDRTLDCEAEVQYGQLVNGPAKLETERLCLCHTSQKDLNKLTPSMHSIAAIQQIENTTFQLRQQLPTYFHTLPLLLQFLKAMYVNVAGWMDMSLGW